MKKFLVLLTSISLGTIVSTNVVACFPPKKDNGNDINGHKLNLDLFAFDKISDKFNLKKDNVIVENKIDLKLGIIKGIQNIISIYLPWNEVDITIETIKPELTTFKQVYVKMVAKDDDKSIKGSVKWGNLEAAAPTYVDLRPNLKAWLSEEQKTLKVDDANKLDVAAFEALGGPALGKSNLTELGLKGVYDPDTNSYTVSADGTKSDFFATSDLVFKAVINK